MINSRFSGKPPGISLGQLPYFPLRKQKESITLHTKIALKLFFIH
jgi:hypothetical protein